MRGTTGRINGRGGSFGRRIKRFVRESELPVAQAWFHSRSIFTGAELQQLYTREFAERIPDGMRGFQCSSRLITSAMAAMMARS